jgi:hypothetical protein
MKRLAICWALLLLAASAAAQAVYPEAELERKFAAGGNIRMRLAPGDYTISGTSADRIRVSYHPTATESGPVKVELQATGSSAKLAVRHTPHNFHADIEVPLHSNLYVRLGAGDLNIRAVSGSKDIENHVGDVNIDVRRPEEYRQVDASVSIGDLAAPAFNVNKDGFGPSFKRQGTGSYRLHLHVGVGDARLYQTN